MKYKVLVLDLDGTTVPSARDGMPSPGVKAAVLQAGKYLKVVVATGRPLILADDILKDLDIKQPCVVDGGAEIVDLKTGKLLFKRYLSAEKQRAVLGVCERFKIPVASSEDQYGSNLLDNSAPIEGEVAKLFIDGVSMKAATALLEELESIEGIASHLASSWNRGNVIDIHITDSEATKKHGVEEVLRILNVAASETIGIGDNHNDVPMLEAVGFKAVMGNAPEELKNLADYVAASLEDDGVADVIKKFVLPAS